MKSKLFFGLSILAVITVMLSLTTLKHAQADVTWCDVLAPANDNSANNCLNGVTENALNGVNTKKEAIDAINRFNSYGGYQRVGAQYIMCDMEQKNQGCSPGNDWENRINNPAVSVSVGKYQTCINSAYDPASNRVVTYGPACGDYTALLFTINNVVRYAIKTDCGNPLGRLGLPAYNPNSPPTGSLKLGCNGDGTGWTDSNFSDPDGNTSADLTINYSDRTPTKTIHYNNSGDHLETIRPESGVSGTWTAKLVVHDNGGNQDITRGPFSNNGCNWALTSRVSITRGTPASVLPGQTASFDFFTRNSTEQSTPNFTYSDRYVLMKNGRYDGTVQQWPNPDHQTSLNGFSSTTSYATWAFGIPANTDADEVCAWRWTSTTSSSDSSADVSVPKACISIVQPGCSGFSTSPGAIEPNVPFDVTASVDMGSKTTANNALGAGDKFYIHINGPQDSTGVGPSLFSNDDVGGLTVDNNGVITAVVNNVGPPNSAGIYNISWGITGPIAAQDCSNRSIDVAYLPYFDVRGGDIAAGTARNALGTACSNDTTADIESWNYDNDSASTHGGYYGAGTQAAAYALRNIKSFATGINPLANSSAVNGRTTAASLQTSLTGNPDDLSFANTGSGVNDNGAGSYGGMIGSLPCPEDYVDDITSGKPSWDGANGYQTSGTYDVSGNVDLDAGQLAPDVVINLRVDGNVFIHGDITYDDSGGPGHYPRLNVFARGNIYLAGSGSVTELHGLFVAQQSSSPGTGIFATCATGTADSVNETTDFDTCNYPLKVYGSVIASHLDLDRTYSTMTSSTGPAEDFVYTPELWLSTSDCTANPSDSECSTGQAPTYNSITNLPPVL